MRKNKWHLTKINSDSFHLSMVALDCAYSIEQLIKNKNQPKYNEYLNSGILLLNLQIILPERKPLSLRCG